MSDDSGWNRETVAALAKLIGELRRLAPDAHLYLVGDEEGEFFFPSIDRVLSATAQAEE